MAPDVAAAGKINNCFATCLITCQTPLFPCQYVTYHKEIVVSYHLRKHFYNNSAKTALCKQTIGYLRRSTAFSQAKRRWVLHSPVAIGLSVRPHAYPAIKTLTASVLTSPIVTVTTAKTNILWSNNLGLTKVRSDVLLQKLEGFKCFSCHLSRALTLFVRVWYYCNCFCNYTLLLRSLWLIERLNASSYFCWCQFLPFLVSILTFKTVVEFL